MTAVAPPPEHAHLRWHWVQFPCGTEAEPVFWSDGEWTTDDTEFSPEEAETHGWRYVGPCDPTALALDPNDPALVERVARALAPKAWATYGKIGIDGLAQESRRTASMRHAKAVIAELTKGSGT